MALHLAIPTVLATQKPLGRPVELDPRLRAAARSIFVLRDGPDVATDQLGNANLAFGTSTAKPVWGASAGGGQGITFDGSNDECRGTIAQLNSQPAWVACTFTVNSDVSTFQVFFGIASNGGTFGSLLNISVDSFLVKGNIRFGDNGSSTSVNGPAAVANRTYHCALISYGITNHVMWVNGVRYTNGGNGGSGGGNIVNASIGHSWRGSNFNFANGTVHWAAYGSVDPGEALLRDLSVDPWALIYANPQIDITLLKAPAAAGDNPFYFQRQVLGV